MVVFIYCVVFVLLQRQSTASLEFLIKIRQKERRRENSWEKNMRGVCIKYASSQYVFCNLKKKGPSWQDTMFQEEK